MHFMVLTFELLDFPPRNMCNRAYFKQKNKNSSLITAHAKPGPVKKSNPAEPFQGH